jgi:hypothetical protein
MQGFRRGARELERQERNNRRSERERAAGTLLGKVPSLTRLDIAFHEKSSGVCADDTRYVRRVVIESAPALFEVSCCGPQCEDGGYDVTREMLRALSSSSLHFEGEQACRGRRGPGDCGRVLTFVATATYADAQPVTSSPSAE